MGRNIRARKRLAFTLIEIMVVITIVGAMAAMGAIVITPQISYFRSRRDGENILLAIRRARSLAMARGGETNSHYGVTIFRGQLESDRTVTVAFDTAAKTPWSYVEFADRDEDFTNNDRNLNERTRPTMGVTLASALTESELTDRISIRPDIMNLHEETKLLGNNGAAISDNTVIEFDSKGKLLTSAGRVSSLLPEPTSSPTAYSFDISNPNMGYYRIRLRVNGTIEVSSLTEEGVTTPYVYDANGDRSDF